MLVLSRFTNEQIVCLVPPSSTPTLITFTVTEIRGDKVRTGWEAPSDVEIHRREVYEAIHGRLT